MKTFSWVLFENDIQYTVGMHWFSVDRVAADNIPSTIVFSATMASLRCYEQNGGNILSMQQVIKDIKHLSSREKATIAHCLIASLENRQDEDINQAWSDLAQKRFAELTSGEVKPVSWSEIHKDVTG